jgi:hypothetical protein
MNTIKQALKVEALFTDNVFYTVLVIVTTYYRYRSLTLQFRLQSDTLFLVIE